MNRNEYFLAEFTRSRKKVFLDEGDLKSLIDLAFDTKDEKWLKDLDERMQELKTKKRGKDEDEDE